jgi:PAS domain S-box-containing protein
MTRQNQPMQGSNQSDTEPQGQNTDTRIRRHLRAAVAGSDDPGLIIRNGVDALAEFGGYDLVAAYLVRDDGLHLLHQVGYDYPVRWLDLDSGICGQVARSGQGLLIADAESEPAYVPIVDAVPSGICVPFGGGDIAAVLNVEQIGPDRLTRDDYQIVADVAGLFSDAIEHATARAARRTSEQRLRLALDAAEMGVWTWTIGSGALDWQSDRDDQLANPFLTIDDLLARAHAGDFAHVDHALSIAAVDGDLDVEFRLVGDGRAVRWVNLRGRAVERGVDGVPRVIAGVVTDVTGRKRLEEERVRLVHLETARVNAEDAQRTMAATIERLRDGFVAVDPELRLALVNEEAARLFGADRSELLGAPLTNALSWLSDEHEAASFISACCNTTEPSSFDVYDARADRFLEIRVFPGSGGATLHLRDVTALRRAEYERQRIEARFRSLVQESSDLILILDRRVDIQFASPAVERLLGFQPEEIVGNREALRVHPADEKRLQRALIRVLRTPGTHPPFEIRVQHRDGSYRWLEVTPTNLLADPMIHGVVANCRDITERHAAEFNLWLQTEVSTVMGVSLDLGQTLETLNRLLVTYLCHVSLVAVFNERGEIEHFAAAEREPHRPSFTDGRLLADRAIDAIGIRSGRTLSSRHTVVVDVSQIDFAETAAPYAALGNRMIQLDLTSAIVVPIVLRGHVRGVLLTGFGADLEIAPALTAMVEDVARRAGLAIENAGLYQHARQAINARDRFLSVAAHELRTPITSVTGYTRMLRRELEERRDPERIARYAGRLDEAGRRLATLAEDLLDVSRIRSGQLPLRKGPVDLAALAKGVALRYAEQRSSARERITVDVPETGVIVAADPDRLEQVLTNLIDNALKYSPPDTTIDLRLELDQDSARLSVRDRGIGVAPDSLESIFEPFGRAGNAEEAGITGLGLGLYISRTIIERLDGSIWAESEGERMGLTVVVQLPLGSDMSAATVPE